MDDNAMDRLFELFEEEAEVDYERLDHMVKQIAPITGALQMAVMYPIELMQEVMEDRGLTSEAVQRGAKKNEAKWFRITEENSRTVLKTYTDEAYKERLLYFKDDIEENFKYL